MSDIIKNHIPFAPFAYTDINLYTSKKEAEKMKFKTLAEQKNVDYTDPIEPVFNNKKLNEQELMWQSFRYGLDSAPVKVKEIKMGRGE